ncbi:hypothetical protein QOZ80_4AG0324080 [Eleusine coracana subsp. coracana]|nr:hypothetical protein QOZ80_4AG0324080 [Eleusine coracana subsp. coracana]
MAYRRLLLLRHLPQQHYLAAATHNLSAAAAAAVLSAPSSRPFAFSTPQRVEPHLGVFRPGFTSDIYFNYSWHHKLGSTVGAVLIGQAAFFIGLSGGSALAQEDPVGLAAAASEQAEGNATGLQRIEDGSVISNEHTVKWRIFTDNARDYFQKRQLDEAEKLFQAALHEAKEGFGLRDPHVASALNNLGEFYRLRKEYEKAELLYLEAIEILEESFGPDDIRVGTALHSLGICYHLQHKFSPAQACYERALKIEGRVMGLGHPEYASTMYLLAKVLSLQGKRKDAEFLIEESIRILEEAGLGESPTCIQRMRYLSTELLKSYRFPEAENWQRKILHALELSKGWDSLETAHAAGLLSLTLQSMGKFKESEELLERCLTVRRKILPEFHFMVAGTLVQLARTKQLTDDSIRIADGILKSSSTSTADMNKVAAALVLLQALDVVGLLEVGVRQMLDPGEQDHKPIKQALNKCISLYKEPNTRGLVSKTLKQDYLTCLKRLAVIVETDDVISRTMELQELLGEAQQIMEELGEVSNREK